MAANLTNPIFTDEAKARQHLEKVRWPDGPVCPHCGNLKQDRIAKVEGKKQSHREGLYYCNECKGQFTVTVGTVFERSKLPLSKWWLAMHLMAASKKGMSAHQMSRMLGISYKSTWFMLHRIREAMRDANPSPMGNNGGPVQADETYYGNTSKRAKGYKKGLRHKSSVVALVEPSTGKARAFKVESANAETVAKIVYTNIRRKATLVTDEAPVYTFIGSQFAEHQTLIHTGREYVNKDGYTTNNVENFFGIFKKGMSGVYHYCGEQHLQRYLDEFSFRYSNRSGLGVDDVMRAELIAKGADGKRLTYRRPN
ncbi:IS1595 family transposase [Pseudorhodoplanes sp.]|uniref:IS1595 family transposase n=1 Tax=Pseudorhodoplanes sp. TaxID=1934341 RepID=UPI00391C3E52